MPGLTGHVNLTDSTSATYISKLIADHPSVSWQPLVESDLLSLAVDPGKSDRTNHGSFADLGGDSLGLWGHCLDTSDRMELTADLLLKRLQANGLELLQKLEGGFHLLWHQAAANAIHLVNDRVGMLPLYLHTTETGITFAHRPRFLSPVLQEKKPDLAGVITFLAIGYCLGSRSLLQDVKVLTPASILTVDLGSNKQTHRRYWDLKYKDNKTAASKDLAYQLHEAILDAVDLTSSDPHQNAGIFLSGGWDCRALLGAQLSLGKKPTAAISNGKSDNIPGSDTDLAKRLAADLGIDYRFCFRDATLSPLKFREGIRQCELITDTTPEVFGQHHPPANIFSGLNYVYKGDEIWGWENEAENREQAIANVMPTDISDSLINVLRAEHRPIASEVFQAEIDSIISGYQSDNWNEIKDYLYLNGRVTRYIFGLGSSDEEHLQVRRPFFTSRVIGVIEQIPDLWRVQKSLFLEMLSRHQKPLFSYRRNHISHIANYYAYMSQSVRDSQEAAHSSISTLDQVLDIPAALKILTDFNVIDSETTTPRQPVKSQIRNYITDRWGYHYYRSNFFRQRSRADSCPWSVSDVTLAFRVFLLSEYFAQGFAEVDKNKPEV